MVVFEVLVDELAVSIALLKNAPGDLYPHRFRETRGGKHVFDVRGHDAPIMRDGFAEHPADGLQPAHQGEKVHVGEFLQELGVGDHVSCFVP